MKRGLFGLLIFLFFPSTTGLGSVLDKTYVLRKDGHTWENAQLYCRRHHNDLATIYSKEDAKNIDLKSYVAWIDLHRKPTSREWVWTDEENVEFHLENDDDRECAAIHYVNYNVRRVERKFCQENRFVACQPKNLTAFPVIHKMMSRDQAENYCSNYNYNGLARFTKEQMKSFNKQDFPIWIKLLENGGSWNFDSDLEVDNMQNFDILSNPTNCVTISSLSNKLAANDCKTVLPFLCITENIVLVKEKRSWEEAFEHCRSLGSSSDSNLHFNLLSVQPGNEHTYITEEITEAETDEVWTALHFLGDEWLWMNGADMLYTDLPQCPSRRQHCGALSKNNTGTLEARDCSERKNLLCYSYNP